ncbi:MAG: GntR family transcriptional regulator [Rubrivivax sp.]|jgi:GntR family transcriptional regulator|nr:GntR family transcriptional regulator [Rubrivivax sp.]
MSRGEAISFTPDLASRLPLYLQLARHLGQLVREGRFKTHEALPSERGLSETLGLSRVTARKAIDQLVGQGLIVRRHGSGNYIAPQIEQATSQLSSFSEELRQRGFKPSSRWLKRACTAATPDEQLSLGLSPGARVARLERLRLADGTVMAYEVSVLPESVLPDPISVDSSLYEHLAERGQAPARALQHLRAMNASPRHAELLGVPTGQALLHITRVGYLEGGMPVELTHSYCRSDLYGFVSEIRRER